LSSIKKIGQLNKDDVYMNVISVSTVHHLWNICCIDSRPVLPRCYKCGKEIGVEDTVWHICGTANYGSHYDYTEDNQVLNGLDFCDCCIYEFVGKIDDLIN
jgi:hypothetical protein